MRANVIHASLQFVKVGAAPVNLSAIAAAPELMIKDPGQRLELIHDFGLGDILQQAIASQTASKWFQPALQIVATKDFNRLGERIAGSRMVGVLKDAMHQESPVTREEDTIVGDGAIHEVFIGSVAVVIDVESERTQVPGKLPQMDISDKTFGFGNLQSILRKERQS